MAQTANPMLVDPWAQDGDDLLVEQLCLAPSPAALITEARLWKDEAKWASDKLEKAEAALARYREASSKTLAVLHSLLDHAWTSTQVEGIEASIAVLNAAAKGVTS